MLGPVVSLLDDMLVQQEALPELARACDAAPDVAADLRYWQGYQAAVAEQATVPVSDAPVDGIDKNYLATLPGEAGVAVASCGSPSWASRPWRG